MSDGTDLQSNFAAARGSVQHEAARMARSMARLRRAAMNATVDLASSLLLQERSAVDQLAELVREKKGP